MFDSNWELIDGEAAHEIEVLNLANQANVIDAVVRFFLHHRGAGEKGCPVPPNQTVLKEFHRTATFLLLEKPGEFRDEDVHVKGAGGYVYEPPPPDRVEGHLLRFFKQLRDRWRDASAVDVGAFTLWFVNWVHPFKNGNGRSARALCYACISLKMGFVLPGYPTVIDLIMNKRNRPDYYRALQLGDEGYARSGEPDLSALVEMIDRLLVQQLETVPES